MSEVSPAKRPAPLVAALGVALIEAIAVVAVGIFGVVNALRSGGNLLGVNVGVLVILVLFAAFLAASVRALFRGYRWGRGPVITWQLLQVAVVVSSWTFLPVWLSVPALAAAVGVTVCLLLPQSREATAGSGHPDAMM